MHNRIHPAQWEFFKAKAEEEENLHQETYTWYQRLPRQDKAEENSKAVLVDSDPPGYLDIVAIGREYHDLVRANGFHVIHPVPEGTEGDLHVFDCPDLYDSILADPSEAQTRRAQRGGRKARKTKKRQSPAGSQNQPDQHFPTIVDQRQDPHPGSSLQAAQAISPQLVAKSQSQRTDTEQPQSVLHAPQSNSDSGTADFS